MKFTAQYIAEFLKGTIDGDKDVFVSGISKIEEGEAGTLSFLANPKYLKYIYTTTSSIVIVNEDFQPEKKLSCTLIRVSDAYQAFAKLLSLYKEHLDSKSGIEANSHIDGTATLGNNVYVGAFAYIGKNVIIGDNVKVYPQVYIDDNVKIDDNTILYAGVKIFSDCKIGKNCIIHGSTVIGSDGFGFAAKSSKDYLKVPQVGNVIIHDDVEIGSNTSIDRATLGSTIIGCGVKIDNLVQIAHNVEIGDNSVIVSQVGIAGSSKIGKNCIIAGQVGIIGHISIADGTKIGAQSGVTANVTKEDTILLGSPAYDIKEHRRSLILFRQLPKLQKEISDLKKSILEMSKF